MSTNEAARQALEKLGRLALREQSMESLLQTVAHLAKDVLPGSGEASVTVIINDVPSTAVSTGALATLCDESQYGHGRGPCLDAATTGRLTEIADARTETRWGGYAQMAAEAGALSSLSVPLAISEGVSAALNVYAREAHAFDDDSRAAASRFAPYAAVALANMHAYQDARKMADNLEVALQSRAIIDQAKGILMERYKLTAEGAFQMLAGVSMGSNKKVRSIAEHLINTGELPAPGRRRP